MKVFHGTTKKGLNAILNGGSKPNSPWTVSDNDGQMYVWPLDKLVHVNDLCDDDLEYQIEHGVRQAFESAEIQAIMEGTEEIFVLELDIPDDLVSDDYSCANMADEASCIDTSDFDVSYIKKVHKCVLNKWSFPFIVANLLRNSLFNRWALDEKLVEVAESINGGHCQEPTEFDYFEYTL